MALDHQGQYLVRGSFYSFGGVHCAFFGDYQKIQKP